MELSGTLKKRCRRTLVKVQGLGILPYNESEDNFNIAHHFTSSPKKYPERFTVGGGNSRRVTRDPIFHMEEGLPINGHDESFGEYYDGGGPSPPSTASATAVDAQARQHLLSESDMRRIRTIIFVGMIVGSYPWKWDRRRTQVERFRPTMVALWKIYTLLTSLQTLFIMLYHVHCFTEQWSGDLESYRGMFAYFLYIYWYGFCLAQKATAYFFEDQIREYINTLLAFNKLYVERYLLFVDKESDYGSGRLVVNLGIPAALMQILNSLMFFVILPYQPWYFMSKIYPKPWYWLIPGAFQDISVTGQVVIMYVTVAWLMVAHTNSVEFWLRETHQGNDSGFTKEELRTPKRSIETYRILQILCTSFNDCLAPVAIPVLKANVMFAMIPCGFLLIRSMNKVFIDEFPGILVYPMGVLNCATMGFGCLSMAAEMYDIANSFISSWSLTKQKGLRRILMSCPGLNVKVARFYFITAGTTITFFQIITGYITDFIITFP